MSEIPTVTTCTGQTTVQDRFDLGSVDMVERGWSTDGLFVVQNPGDPTLPAGQVTSLWAGTVPAKPYLSYWETKPDDGEQVAGLKWSTLTDSLVEEQVTDIIEGLTTEIFVLPGDVFPPGVQITVYVQGVATTSGQPIPDGYYIGESPPGPGDSIILEYDSTGWVGDFDNATITMYVTGIVGGRLDGDATAATDPFRRGYYAELDIGGRVFLKKYAMSNGTIQQLAQGTGTIRQVSGTALGVIQELFFACTDEPEGVRLRAWVNKTPDAPPDLDYVDVGIVAAPTIHRLPGRFFQALTNPYSFIDEFDAEDYFEETVRFEGCCTFPARNLEEIRAAVRIRLNRGTGNSQIGNDVIDDTIREASSAIFMRLGDNARWLETKQTLTIDIDEDGFSVLPCYVARVHRIWDKGTKTWIKTSFDGYDTSGNVRLQVPRQNGVSTGSETWDFYFVVRPQRMYEENDPSWIPDQQDEALVYGATYRIAALQGDDRYAQSMERAYERALLNINQWANTQLRGTGAGVRTRPSGYIRTPGGIPAWQIAGRY